MWLALARGALTTIDLEERQSIFPAPDGSEQELAITTRSRLTQTVLLATPRVMRLAFKVERVDVTMTLGAQAPAPWPEPAKLAGRGFELMLTERGPLIAPAEGERLPTRLASWLDQLAENVRSCWPVPPSTISMGSEWEAMPAVPGGLPPGALSAVVKIQNRIAGLAGGIAQVAVKFGVRVVFDAKGPNAATKGEGRGEVLVQLDRAKGVLSASRTGRMELIRPTSKSQVLRSQLELRTT
jgi:hypothetical protein